MSPPSRPLLSVIVPVRDCAAHLEQTLPALAASTLPRERWELIVVDDASADTATATVARRYADAVLRLRGRARGPAYARNQGVMRARGEVLVFVDADVRVHADTLERFAAAFAGAPDVAAVFGAYDTEPPVPGFVSQYRNLAHHYVHATNAGVAETFWTGCGAIRRSVFLRAGGFNAARYPRPQVEDIELGYRVNDLGYRIELRPEIRATHLKRWTLSGMLLADIRDRGVPWTKLLLERRNGARRGVLNVSRTEKLVTLLAALALVLGGASLWTTSAALASAALLCAVVGLGLNLPILCWFARQRGLRFALGVIPLRALGYWVNALAAATGWMGWVAERLRGRAWEVSGGMADRLHAEPFVPAARGRQ